MMKKAMWQLTVRSDFSAAHALRHYQGKCENMHGHNYQVELAVRGEKLTADTEFMMDFSKLKNMLKEELSLLDHKNLNETPPFDRLNPSSENLARYLYHRLEVRLDDFPVSMDSVTVSEKNTQSATYREVDD